MQGKCVNNPGNEVDSRFEGNGVLTPDMSQLLERLPDANCVDGLMQGDFVHNPGMRSIVSSMEMVWCPLVTVALMICRNF